MSGAIQTRVPVGNAGLLGECATDGQRQRECGMRGEYGGETGSFHTRAVFRPTHGGIVGIGTQDGVGEVGEGGIVLPLIRAANIVRQPFRPRTESGVAQMADESGD